MKKKIYVLTLLAIIVLLVACKETDKPVVEVVEKEPEVSLDHIGKELASMTLDEKIGQLMILGFNGKDFNDNLGEKLREVKPGGLIFFTRNIGSSSELVKTINKIKAYNRSGNKPLFIALDEEGGDVSRIPKDLNKLPRAKDIGSLNDGDLIKDFGKQLGVTVRSLGFNLNNGPVLDIRYNPNNEITRTRSYGKTEELVSFAGLKVLEGVKEEGVLALVKHFPGHGSTDVDSHYQLPIVNKTYDDLRNQDILPFKKAIDQGVDGVMVGHVLYKNIDSKLPASLSKKIMVDLLREDLGYEGLIFSDDMTMGAITNSHEPVDGALMFLQAGGDVVFLCHGENVGREFIKKVKKAIDDGRLTEEEIDEKVYRILKTKEAYKINDDEIPMPNIDKLNGELRDLLNSKSKDKRQQVIE